MVVVLGSIYDSFHKMPLDIGVLPVYIYSPFPASQLHNIPASTKVVCVVERVDECDSSFAPLFLKVVTAFHESMEFSNMNVLSFTYQGTFTTNMVDCIVGLLRSSEPPRTFHFHNTPSPSSLPPSTPTILTPPTPSPTDLEITFSTPATLLRETFANLAIWEVGSPQSSFNSPNFHYMSTPNLETGFGSFMAYSHKHQQLVDEIVKLLQDPTFGNSSLKGVLSAFIPDKPQNGTNGIFESFNNTSIESLLDKEIQQAPPPYLPSLNHLHANISYLSTHSLSPACAWLVCNERNTDVGSILSILETGEKVNLLFVSSATANTLDSKNILIFSPLLFFLFPLLF